MPAAGDQIVKIVDDYVAGKLRLAVEAGGWGPPDYQSSLTTYRFFPDNGDAELGLKDWAVTKFRYANWVGGAYGDGKFSPRFAFETYSNANELDAAYKDYVAKYYADPSSAVKDAFDELGRQHDLLYQEANAKAVAAWRAYLVDLPPEMRQALKDGGESAYRDLLQSDEKRDYATFDLWFLKHIDDFPPTEPFGIAIQGLARVAFSLTSAAGVGGEILQDIDGDELLAKLGEAYGSHIGKLIGGDGIFADIGDTIGGKVGEELAKQLAKNLGGSANEAGEDHRSLIDDAFNLTFSDIAQLGLDEVVDLGKGRLADFTQLLLGEAAEFLDLNEFGTAAFNRTGKALTTYLTDGLIDFGGKPDVEFMNYIVNDFSLEGLVNYFVSVAVDFGINSFASSILEDVKGLVSIDSVAEGYFAAAGSIAGSVISTFIPFPTFGVLETLGHVIGSLQFEVLNFITAGFFEDIFDPEPNGMIFLDVDPATGLLHRDGSHWDDIGDSPQIVQAASAMTEIFTTFVNGLITATGSQISTDGFFRFQEKPYEGHHVNHAAFGYNAGYMRVTMDGPRDNFSASDRDLIIRVGIEYEVSKLIFYGGDLAQVRAIGEWRTDKAAFAQGESVGLLMAYQRTAQEYRRYLENTETINFLIVENPNSPYTLGWIKTLADASALGLDKAYVGSDDGAAGTEKADTILTADGADLIFGNAGNDTLRAYGGADTIYGGEGSDSISGGGGDDLVGADVGDDTISGGAGNDGLYGYLGDDRIAGDGGDDQLAGEEGSDTVLGGAGDDVVYGDGPTGVGADVLSGGDGDDLVRGGRESDRITGDAGDDRLYGDEAADTVSGGAGTDTVFGGAGDDSLTGDAGDDRVVGDTGHDVLTGGDGADQLYGLVDNDTLDGGAGADLLLGDDGADLVTGGDGADSLSGWRGDDVLLGGAGDDTLAGEDHADILVGGDGADLLYGDRAPEPARGPHTVQELAGRLQAAVGASDFGFLYQGDGYTVQGLAASPHDLLVINPAATGLTGAAGSEVLWSREEIAQIDAAGKLVIGYLNVAKVNDFTGMWDPAWTRGGLAAGVDTAAAPAWLGEADPAFQHTRLVDFWEPGWRDALFARVDTMIAQGFEGVFLDDALDYFVRRGDTTAEICQAARDMRDLIVALREHATATLVKLGATAEAAQKFVFILNGAPFIIADTTLDGHVAAPGQDAAFFSAIDVFVGENYVSQGLDYALEQADKDFGARGIPLLSVDTGLVSFQQRIGVMADAVDAGFLPYATATTAFDALDAPVVPGFGDVRAPGGDTLEGGAGDDTLVGGAGADVMRFTAGSGRDIVIGFSRAEGDRIQLAPGAFANAAQVGNDTVVTQSDGSQMVLRDVRLADLDAGWLFG